MQLATRIRYIFATIAAQIKLDTRNGLTDLSKSQEKSLLGLINLAYAKKFKDMNAINSNYPAIDYGDFYNSCGLQMTVTVAKQKFQSTLIKLLKYDSNKSFKELWFFLLIVDALPNNALILSLIPISEPPSQRQAPRMPPSA
ncbi:SMEK domain-containing protein [Acinetobacter courvalinii]|uniref:SMEK domain-containing protein n=1 Tax=Acinetobacter courvalinii TaxID=280147 RepID=UPI003A86BCC2